MKGSDMTPEDVAATRAFLEEDCTHTEELRALCDALEAAWAVITDQTRDFGIRLDMQEERAERAEAELAAIKRTDMDRDDVQGMLDNAHAAADLFRQKLQAEREAYDRATTRQLKAEAALARVKVALATWDGQQDMFWKISDAIDGKG